VASKWRVVSSEPLKVFQDFDCRKFIADLQSSAICDLLHDDVRELPDGSVRGMIIDPIWKGWVTVRTRSGSNLEVVKPPREQLTSVARVIELRDEALADDIECDMVEMVLWSEAEVADFFASGGMNSPQPRRSHDGRGKLPSSPPCVGAQGTGAAATDHPGSEGSSAAEAGPSSSASDAKSDREQAARDAGEWRAGTMVLLSGLTTMRELNGRSGVLGDFVAQAGRYEVRLATRTIRAKPAQLTIHPLQRQKDAAARGDELVFLSADAQLARTGTYAVKLDPQFWYDQALERVFAAAHEFEVLELPAESTDDLAKIRKQYRKISLAVHPDKNKHPQADAAFRKVYGAFETLSDFAQQRRLLRELGRGGPSSASEREAAHYGVDDDGDNDDDDALFQWWWEASVPSIQKAAEEAEGADMDSYAALYVSDGLGGDVNDVRWMGVDKARDLHAKRRVIFIDCREAAEYCRGGIPGAWHVPMTAVMDHGIVAVLGEERIHELLDTQRNSLIVVYSSVATPFSRCRAFCRWLLRAGHHTLPVQRFRRLRGGLFGWEHRGGTVAKPIGHAATAKDALEERLRALEAQAETYTTDVN